MLSLFEEEITEKADRTLDVRCASCIGEGTRRDGTVCSGCGGAGWLQLGNHEPPCVACHDPRRQLRPEPPGLPETYTRFVIDGRRHRERPTRPPYGYADSFAEAMEIYKRVLCDEFSDGGVVTITETLMKRATHEALDSWVRHEGRR